MPSSSLPDGRPRRPLHLRVVAAAGAVAAVATLGGLTALPARADSVTAPVADATVSGESNYTNYGTTATLEVDAAPIVRSYLKFTVSGVSTPVTKATLRLYPLSSNSAGVSANATDNNWTESSILFSNANGIGAALGSSGPVTAQNWTSVDVSSLVKGNGTFSLLLSSTSATSLSLGSRQSATPPQLIVSTTTAPAPTPTPTPGCSVPTPAPTASPTVAPTASPTVAPTPAPVSNRKLLIHHGWDIASPTQIKNKAALIDSRPFDGLTVELPGLSSNVLSGTAYSTAQFANALAPMPALTKVTHNFPIMRMMAPSYDFYNDALWATMAQNAANLAQATRANGKFDGLVLDNEYYGSGQYPWNYGTSTTPWTPSGSEGATPGRSATEARDIVTKRGKQVMDAILSTWPSAKVMSMYGPWVGETKTASVGFANTGYNDTAWANELMGAFGIGMVQSATANPSGTYIDGGELYQARTAAQYLAAYNWVKTGLARSGSFLVPPALVANYGSRISSAWGVYDRDMISSGWPVMSTSTYQNQLTLALKQADRYTWAYNEVHDWLGTGHPATPVPDSWVTATANARNAANP